MLRIYFIWMLTFFLNTLHTCEPFHVLSTVIYWSKLPCSRYNILQVSTYIIYSWFKITTWNFVTYIEFIRIRFPVLSLILMVSCRYNLISLLNHLIYLFKIISFVCLNVRSELNRLTDLTLIWLDNFVEIWKCTHLGFYSKDYNSIYYRSNQN